MDKNRCWLGSQLAVLALVGCAWPQEPKEPPAEPPEPAKAQPAQPGDKKKPIEMEFVKVPGGAVEIGRLSRIEFDKRTAKLPRNDNEETARLLFNEPEITKHYLPVRHYFLGRTEVTVAQFRAFVRDTGYKTEAEKAGEQDTWVTVAATETDQHPVVCVTWNDAQAFCRWMTKVQGRGVCRLPSEIEWEWACRPGWRNADGSDNLESIEKRANVASLELQDVNRDRAAELKLTHRDGFATTAPVASFKANELGLHDMVGNVSEWTATRFTGTPFLAGTLSVDRFEATDKATHAKADIRFVRGGSWWGGGYSSEGIGHTGFAGASAKTLRFRDGRTLDIGFRVLWDDRADATAPDDDLPYSEIDKLIIAVVNAPKDKAPDRMPEFKQLVGQGERGAERLVYALRTLWELKDPRPAKTATAALVAIGPVALPALDRAEERWDRYRRDVMRAAGEAFGIEREAREDYAWVVVPIDSQPLSRPLAQEAQVLEVRLGRVREVQKLIKGK